MCSLPGSPGLGWDAGQSDGDILPAGAGSWGSSQDPPACQGLGCGISQVFPGWCAWDVCWGWSLLLSLVRICPGAVAPGEKMLLPCLAGGRPGSTDPPGCPAQAVEIVCMAAVALPPQQCNSVAGSHEEQLLP